MPLESAGELGELGTIPDHTAASGDGAVPQLEDHERLIGPVLVPEAPSVGPVEAEPSIVRRRAQYHHEAIAGAPAGREALANEAAADAPALLSRQDGERGQAEADSLDGLTINLHWAEGDIA